MRDRAVGQDEQGRWSNRAEDTVDLVPYDPRWAEQFAAERRAIRQEVDASIALVVEHFGSTAIPGMTAKPIIDILIGAERWTWPDIVAALVRLEYVHWADNPDQSREFLVKGMPPFGRRRTHHVHIAEAGDAFWERVLFRDYLASHPEDARAYADLKRRLAADHPDDRETYTRGKDALVAEIMARARAWRRA